MNVHTRHLLIAAALSGCAGIRAYLQGGLTVFFLVFSTIASADVKYTYTSTPLGYQGPAGFADPFTIDLVFSNDGSELLSWVATHSEIGSISNDTPPPQLPDYAPTIYFATSPTGDPTVWFFNAYTQYSGTPYWETLFLSLNEINSQGVPLPGYRYDQVAHDSPPPDVQSIGFGYSYSPGTWTSTGALANLSGFYHAGPSPIPEPSSFLLILAGLGAILGSKAHLWRKARSWRLGLAGSERTGASSFKAKQPPLTLHPG